MAKIWVCRNQNARPEPSPETMFVVRAAQIFLYFIMIVAGFAFAVAAVIFLLLKAVSLL